MFLWGITEEVIYCGAATANELVELFHVNFILSFLFSNL